MAVRRVVNVCAKPDHREDARSIFLLTHFSTFDVSRVLIFFGEPMKVLAVFVDDNSSTKRRGTPRMRRHSRPQAAGEDTDLGTRSPPLPMADTRNGSRTCNRSRKSKMQVQRKAKNSLSWGFLRRWLSCKDQNDVQGKKKSNKTACSVSFCRMRNSPSVVKPEITTPESSKRLAASSSLNTPGRSFRSPSKDISGAISTSFSSHSSASITASVTSSSSSLGGSFKGMHLRKLSGCYECHVMADPTNGPSRDASMRATICPCPDCGEVFMRSETLELHQAISHAVSELGAEDTSRNIIEIIFQSSWLKNQTPVCKIDRILKVHNTQKAITRFEDYRDSIKMKANKLGKKHPRCVADGNELLRFYSTTCGCSLGLHRSTSLCQSIKHCNVCSIIRDGFKVDELGKIRTMATSGMAHDMAHASSDDENRAMLVCRVIAGRVKKSQEAAEEFDSVTGVAGAYSNMDELFVFSPKAILPCFFSCTVSYIYILIDQICGFSSHRYEFGGRTRVDSGSGLRYDLRVNPYIVGIFVPLFVVSIMLRESNDAKKRGLLVDAGGEPGYAVRNHRFASPVESLWEGVSTLAELFEQSCKRFACKPLLGSRELISRETEVSQDGRSFEKLHLGNYQWISYDEAFKAVCNIASGLLQLGIKKNDHIAIFCETRAEWFLALQGCFRRNLTVVTVYASLGEHALCHSLNETEVSTVICGHKELRKLIGISGQLDTVKHVIYIGEDSISTEVSLAKENTSWMITSFTEVERMGTEKPVDADLPLSSDLAVIMYTSGSTGLPKGVLMTHGNVLATVSAVMTINPSIGTKDIYMAYLPLAHIFELAAEIGMVAAGISVGYGSLLTLTDTSNKIKKGTKGDASVLRPTLMAAVPAILDRVRDAVRKKVDAKGGLSKKLFDVAYGRRMAAINGSWFGAWGLEKVLWDYIVFRKVRAVLGGHVRHLLSGAAPLSGDTQRFINICLGALIGQGYGLTETCGGGTFSDHDDTSVGRAGAPLPCSYVKLIDWPEGGYLVTDSPMPRGEIVIGGPNVTSGYFKNEEKTKEAYKFGGLLQCCF
ncbi:unnamed protein product [Musa banksii]